MRSTQINGNSAGRVTGSLGRGLYFHGFYVIL